MNAKTRATCFLLIILAISGLSFAIIITPVPPTPADGATINYANVTINVTADKNVSSCILHTNLTSGMPSALPVSAGDSHTCYLLSGGNSVCYGSNGSGESTGYTGTDATALSAADGYACYLLANGNSRCYGDDSSGQSDPYAGGDAVSVSAGTNNACYVLSNGSSACNGDNGAGKSEPYGGGNAVAVAAGYDTTCYLLGNGNSACYGGNFSGQGVDYSGGNAVRIAQSKNYPSRACYVLNNGNGLCYGDLYYGHGPDPSLEYQYPGGDAADVSTGGDTVCYLLASGNSVCYGDNSSGQATGYAGGDAMAVAVGSGFTCYALSSGNSVCYGGNSSGQATGYAGGDILPPAWSSWSSWSVIMNVTNADAGTFATSAFTVPQGGTYGYTVNCTDLNHTSNTTAGRTFTLPPYLSMTNVSATPLPGATSALVSWRTFLPANSTVYYGQTQDLGAAASNASVRTSHYVLIAGLVPMARYYYNISSCTLTGLCNTTGPYNFSAYVLPVLAFVPPTPADGLVTNSQDLAFNVSVDQNVSACYLYLNYSSGLWTMDLHNADASTYANYTIAGMAQGAYGYNASCTDLAGNSSRTTNRTFTVDMTPPSIAFIPPTPADNETIFYNNVTINVSANKDASACDLNINYSFGLWTNIRHLGISGGSFDYNASMGVGNYSSFNMLNRNPVAADGYHTYYLLSNGNSTWMGVSGTGEGSPYYGGDAIAMATGENHTCYLRANGNSVCYGDNSSGQITYYTGGDAIAVSAGTWDTCYLLSSGNSICYGLNYSGQNVPYTGGDAIAIAMGTYHVCYLLANGNVVCRGEQILVNGSFIDIPDYTGGDAIGVAAGAHHICYLRSNGNSVCVSPDTTAQTTTYAGGDAIAVSASGDHTCYLKSNGNATCYGVYYEAPLTHSLPNYTGGDAIAIASGYNHVCYLLSNGTSVCYGNNNHGQASPYHDGGIRIPFPINPNPYISLPMSVHNAGSAAHADYTLLNLPFATYLYNVNCTDLAGNTNRTGNMSFTVAQDVTPPSITFVPPTPDDGETMTTLPVTVAVSLSENVSACFITINDSVFPMSFINAGPATSANGTITGLANGIYAYGVNCTDSSGNSNRTANRTLILNVDYTPPSMNFTAPTPDDGAILHVPNATMNLNLSENASACHLFLFKIGDGKVFSQLWNNVSHLRLYGGQFDYNASAGAGGYSSFNANNRIPVAAGNDFTCYLLSSGNSTCYGDQSDYGGGNAVAAAAGNAHICYVLTNGNSACYGTDSYGDTRNYAGGDAIALSAGDWHTCYLRANGTSACYGSYNNGTLASYVVIPLSANYTGGDAITMASGDNHVCYLLSNGNSACYGRNEVGQSTDYAGGDAIAVTAGDGFTCYLLSNGNSRCYGWNDYGRAANYAGGDALALSGGVWNTCYLLSNGNSTCYGDNNYGQSTNYTGSDAIAVSSGGYHACYLLADGSSACYGINGSGQCTPYSGGNLLMPFAFTGMAMAVANAGAATTAAIAVSNLSNGTYIYYARCNDTAGNSALTSTRILSYEYADLRIEISDVRHAGLPGDTSAHVTWATNIGANSTVAYGTTPSLGNTVSDAAGTMLHNVTLTGLAPHTAYYYNVTSCASGGICSTSGPFTLFLDSTPLALDFAIPTPDNGSTLLGLSMVVNVSVNRNVTSCHLSFGSAPLWDNVKHLGIYGGGFDYNASTGAGGNASFNANNVRSVATGNGFICYLLSSGNSLCRGDDIYGQAANYSGGDAISVSAGNDFTCYLLSSGNSRCYGNNGLGQATNYSGGNAIAVAAGTSYGSYVCYLLGSGNSSCYGDNSSGQSTNYGGGDAIAVAAGSTHTCYLLSNGNSTCYGNDLYGQSTVYGGGNAIGVAAGTSHTCYLLSNGNSTCYGNNNYGQSDAYGGGNALEMAAGAWHTCYLFSSGNATCYGDDSYGQIANYSSGDAIAVSAGDFQTCYLLAGGSTECYGDNTYGQTAPYEDVDLKMPFATASVSTTIFNADAGTSAWSTVSNLKRSVNYSYGVACINAADRLSNATGTRHLSVASASPVSSCTVINTGGAYQLDTDLSGAPNVADGRRVCIAINASGVFLDCSGHTITNNGTATAYGVYVLSSTSGAEVHGCNVSGYLSGFALNRTSATLSSDRHYNDSLGLLVEGNCTLAMNGNVFAPAGSLQNYTTLSVNATTGPGEAYSINWSASPAALPYGYASFAQKFVNISTVAGSPSLGTVVWSWTDAEAASYNESIFRLLEYNGSVWARANATLDASANTLSLSDLGSFSVFGILQINDSTPPAVALGSPSNGVSMPSPVTFGFTATDDVSPALDCALFVDGFLHNGNIPAPSGTPVTAAASLSTGSHYWFVECSDEAGNVNTSETWNITVRPVVPPPSHKPTNCNDTERYADGQCVAVPCPCGVVSNHQCTSYACCLDSDCTHGKSCTNHTCVVTPPPNLPAGPPATPPVTPGGCNASDQCAAEQSCDNGVCSNVTGRCGYAADHAWVTYACGPEPGCPACPQKSSCIERVCVPAFSISAPATGLVGEGVKVTVTRGTGPCGGCGIVWTSPSGRRGTGTTDANGTYVIPLNETGPYRAVVAKDPAKSAVVTALSKPAPPEGQLPLVLLLSEASPYLLWLLLLLLITLGLIIYLRRRGKKAARKEE